MYLSCKEKAYTYAWPLMISHFSEQLGIIVRFTSKVKTPLLVSVPMIDVYHCIPPNKFIRISRSIVLNLNFITKIVGNQIELADGTRLLIGKTYREDILSGFTLIGSRKRFGR